MSWKRVFCLACFLLLSACKPASELLDGINRLVTALTPEQHREFADSYFSHILAGDTEAAQSMVATELFCFADRRGAAESDIEAMQQCSEDDAVLTEARRFIAGRIPDETRLAGYHWNRNADGVEIDLSMEYRFGADIVRARMLYRQNEERRWIDKTMVVLDPLPLQQRMLREFDKQVLLPLWIMLGTQLLFYLSIPAIVLWILRRQRRQRDAMLDKSRNPESRPGGHFEA